MKKAVRIAVTGAAGQISYSLLFRLASGELFGRQQPIILHLLELPQAVDALKGVVMELQDCAFPLLQGIRMGDNPKELFKDVEYAFLVGAKPRGPGMERSDLLKDNGKIFIEQGRALNESAHRDVKVLVVGNPCNTNCLIAMHNAPDLPKKNFFAMMRLDQNRSLFQLADKAKVLVTQVSHMAIWGNHSSTLVPDFFNAKISGRPVVDVIQDRSWLEETFIQRVQKRGAEIITARGKSSAASAASAAIDSMRALLQPTPIGEWFSLGVYSTGNSYGIQEDLIFSFPCRSQGDGSYEIVNNLPWNTFLEDKIKITEKELIEERNFIRGSYGK